MAINPMIAMMGQVSNPQAAIQSGLQTAQQIRRMPIQAALDRQSVQQGQQQLQLGEQSIQQNTQALQQNRAQQAMQRGAMMNQLSGEMLGMPLDQRASYLARKMPILEQMGMTREQIMSQGLTDQDLQQVFTATRQFAPQADPNAGFTLKPGEVRYAPDGSVIAEGGDVPDENAATIQKEVRSELRGQVSGLRTTAGNLRSNYEKLQNLADQMRTGNRTAVSQGLVALVKLGDPTSVVREAEMEAALNKENPLAAVTNLLQSRGTASDVVSAVASKIDPLSPENINVDDVLSTANAMMIPNIQEINRSFDIVKSRATENLTPEGIRSVYGKPTEDLFGELRTIEQRIAQSQPRQGGSGQGSGATQPAPEPTQTDMGAVVVQHPQLGNITEADIQATMRNNNVTREQVLQMLNGGAQ